MAFRILCHFFFAKNNGENYYEKDLTESEK